MSKKTRAKLWQEALVKVGEASAMIQSIAEDIEEQIDNMPDNLQSGARYDNLMDLQSELEDYVGSLDEILEAEPFA